MYIIFSLLIGIIIGIALRPYLKGLPYDMFHLRVKRMYKKEGLIHAIKLYREIHDVGLREAKDAVEDICNHQPQWRN